MATPMTMIPAHMVTTFPRPPHSTPGWPYEGQAMVVVTSGCRLWQCVIPRSGHLVEPFGRLGYASPCDTYIAH